MSYKIKNWEKFQHYKDKSRHPDWVKLYRELLDDVDWHELSGDDAKSLVMLWLLASEDESLEGRLPSVRKIAFRLRQKECDILQLLKRLDHWLEQDDSELLSDCYQSDSPERKIERIEERKKEEEKRAAAIAAPDPRSALFGRGLETLARITGKTPDSCRSLVGKLLKLVDDEAIHVLGAIEDADRNRVADPVAWITRALKPKERNFNNASTPKDIAKQKWRESLEQLGRYAEGTDSDISEAPIRLLPGAGNGR